MVTSFRPVQRRSLSLDDQATDRLCMKISYSISGQTRQATVSEMLRLFDQSRAAASSQACLSLHYNSKHLHIYFGGFGGSERTVGVEFAGPGLLDGGSGSVDVETAKAALRAI